MLSHTEVTARMVELRNLRELHTAQKIRIEKLKEENKRLRMRVSILEATVATQRALIADLKLQMEELRTIVFGRKRKREENHDDTPPPEPPTPIVRTPDSYKRTVPTEDDVTEKKPHPIDACVHCHGSFSERDSVTFFEEDIRLPQKRMVIKHTIDKGYCVVCKKWSASVSVPTAPVILGKNVKRYVTYLSIVCRQSYSQTQDLLLHTYDFNVSQGEIAKILEKEGERMRSEYERLKARIRGEPSVHLDETSWSLFIGDGCQRYAWTMVGGQSAEAIFVLGKTRGKGNATKLLADSKAVVVSDDYGAYRKLVQPHQLCLAHILRKVRDLAQSDEVKGDIHCHCKETYQTFAGIYADVETARISSNPAATHKALLDRLHGFVRAHPLDPAKLSRVKNQVRERIEQYLTCLIYPGVASDNNAAERSLRHLVLKRKISFGSLSERTAKTLAILLSVLMSLKQRGMLRGYLMGV
jgi:transposase